MKELIFVVVYKYYVPFNLKFHVTKELRERAQMRVKSVNDRVLREIGVL